MFGRRANGANLSVALTLSLTACLGGQESRSGRPVVGAVRAALAATWQRTSRVETYKVDETMTYSGFSQEPGSCRTSFYSDFDKAVTITAPPRTQVGDPYVHRLHRQK